MPNIKEVKNRIGSVKSTQQLTKAMKMVAAAKLKRAQDKVTELRPYSNKLNEILSNLSDSISNVLFEQRDVKNKLFMVVASDKGLCGSFNSNIFKLFNSVSENNNDHLDIKKAIKTLNNCGNSSILHFLINLPNLVTLLSFSFV